MQHNPYHQHNIGTANIPTTAIPNAYNFMNATAAAALNLAYGQHFSGAHQFHHLGYPANQMPQLNQPQHHIIPNMQHSAGGVVKNLRTVELPFYDLIKVYFF